MFSIIFVFVICLSVFYLFFNNNLNINSNSNNSSGVSVLIERMSIDSVLGNNKIFFCSNAIKCEENYYLRGKAELNVAPIVYESSIKKMYVSIFDLDDEVVLYYKIKNNGTSPIEYYDVEYDPGEFSSNSIDDVILAEKNFILDVELTTKDKDFFEIGNVICPGDYVIAKVSFKTKESISDEITEQIIIANLGVNFKFNAVSSNVCVND